MIATCPSDDALRRYAIGDIEDQFGQEIESHVAECPACEETIAQFDSADDTLMRHLPLAAASADDESAVPPGWLEQLREGPTAGQAARQPAENDFAVSGDDVTANGSAANFNAYELVGVLGRGGMGVVYRARHRQLNRQVALKVLSPRLIAAPEARRRFEREIQVLGGLHHPGIVMATDAGRVGEAAYLVMELVDGVDLARLVRNGGPLAIGEACESARQMAEALVAAHEAGAVHRDVKPSNAMVDRRGRVKLLDFGLAHLHTLSTESLETSLGRLLGTLDYMAPEQASGEESPGASADLYGLGATLFYLLTGRPPHGPHAGRSLVQQLRALVDGQAPRVSSLRADVPAELDEFVARLLSREPQDRPASAEDVAKELARWAEGDLSARVAEAQAAATSDATQTNDSVAAANSLCELLGGSRSDTRSFLSEAAPAPAGMAGRIVRGGRWLAAAAAFFAAFYGIVILLKTPEGTLRIESEIDDVQVSLMDEKSAVRELTVSRDGDTTKLAAGRYQVRFKGNHDGMRMDRDVIELTRGQTRVVRISKEKEGDVAANDPQLFDGKTRVEWQSFLRAHAGLNLDQNCTVCHKPSDRAIPIASDAMQATREVTNATSPVYKGKPESEWKRLFLAETEPAAKLDAATALMQLAGEKPVEERITQILDVGEGIVRTGLGDKSYEFGYTRLAGVPKRDFTQGALQKQYDELLDQAAKLLRPLPPVDVAAKLSEAAMNGQAPRAAFAMFLLRSAYAASGMMDSSEASNLIVHTLSSGSIDSYLEPLHVITRACYARRANVDRATQLNLDIVALAKRLRDAPPSDWNDKLADSLLISTSPRKDQPVDRQGWPKPVRIALARLVLDGVLESRPYATERFGERLPAAESAYPDPLRTNSQRTEILQRSDVVFLDEWLTVANEYFKAHREAPFSTESRKVFATLDTATQLYEAGYDWPAAETASLLTDALHGYYSNDPKATTDVPVAALLPGSAADVLAQIVRLTGKIPEFALTGVPKPPLVKKGLNELRTLLDSELVDRSFGPGADAVAGLFESAPYQCLEMCLGENKLTSGGVRGGSGQILFENALFSGRGGISQALLYAVSKPGQSTRGGGNRGSSTRRTSLNADFLLVLAMLDELTGKDEAMDARIAALFGADDADGARRARPQGQRASMFLGQARIVDYLSGSIHSGKILGEHARRMLNEMAAKTKNASLTETIKAILPPEEEKSTLPTAVMRETAPETAATSKSPERLYNGKPESEWQRLFAAETQVAAKFEAAEALVNLAAQKPAEAQIEQFLQVGEGCVRVMYPPADVLFFAFEDSGYPTGYFLSGSGFGGSGGRAARGSRGRGTRGAFSQSGVRTLPDSGLNRNLLELVSGLAGSLPIELYTTALCKAATTGPDARAAFALRLLSYPPNRNRKLTSNPNAAQIALRDLNVPLGGVDRSAACLLVRAGLLEQASDAGKAAIYTSLSDLAERLDGARNGSLAQVLKGAFLDVAHEEKSWPAELQRASAQLVYDDIRQQRTRAVEEYFDLSPSEVRSVPNEEPLVAPYGARYVAAEREKTHYFLNAWLPLANRYLANGRNAPPVTGDLVRTLDKVVPLYSDGDNWPAEQTAAILTKWLGDYYAQVAIAKTGNTIEELPASPAVMLTQIVRITGKIPDSLRADHPLPKDVADKLKAFEKFLTSERQQIEPYPPNSFAGLFEVAPLEVIKLALADTKELPKNYREGGTARLMLTYTSTGGDVVTRGGETASGRPDSIVDPLLLVAALANLTGENEAQDARIANLIGEINTGWGGGGGPSDPIYQQREVGLAGHLRYLLASPLKAREYARRMLAEMATKAKSAALVEAIKGILPDPAKAAPARTTSIPTAALDSSQSIDAGKSEADWRKIFEIEVYGPAKLEAGIALLQMTEKLPANQQLDRILDIGEEYLRSRGTAGDNWSFALRSWLLSPATSAPPQPPPQASNRGQGRARGVRGTGGRGTPFGSAQRPADPDADLLRQRLNLFKGHVKDRVLALPLETVPGGLCKAAVGESEPRAVFALMLLRDLAPTLMEGTPAAAQVVMRELRATLVSIDKGDALLLTRLQYLPQTNDAERKELYDALNQMAMRFVRENDRNRGPATVQEELLREARKRIDWPTDLKKSFATLIYLDLFNELGSRTAMNYFSLAQSELGQTAGEVLVPPYDQRFVAAARSKLQFFMDQWPALASQNLRGRRQVLRSLEFVLPLYSDGDDWPIDQTAAKLTEELRNYYNTDVRVSNNRTETRSYQAMPAQLLTQIVGITGKIPELAATAKPNSNVAEKLQKLEEFLGGEREKFGADVMNYFAGLYDAAPLEVIRLSLGETKTVPIRGRRVVYDQPLTPRYVLTLATTGFEPQQVPSQAAEDTAELFVDPLLLLAAMTELAGENEARDARIASLLSEDRTGYQVNVPADPYEQQRSVGIKGHLQRLLASQLKSRDYARRMLTEMAAKAKSPALVEAIGALDAKTVPAAAAGGEPQAPEVADSPAESPAEPQDAPAAGPRRGRRGGANPQGAAALPATDLSASAAVKLAKQGQWDAAAKAFAAEVEAKPNEYVLQILGATVEHHLGHEEEYRKYCTRLLERFGETGDPRAAERIARLCSIAPSGVKEYAPVDRLMDRSLELDGNSDYWRMWDALSKAIVDYRAGRPASAENWLNKCQTYAAGTVGSGHRASRDGILNATLALAMIDQGKIEDAKSALEEARTILKLDLPDFPAKAYAGTTDDWVWFDALHCLFLIEEAEKKLGIPKERKPVGPPHATTTSDKAEDKK